jgi:hypothetical protein
MDREIARRPGPRALARIRQWLGEGAVVAWADAADAPLYTLSAAEQTQLAGLFRLAAKRANCGSASAAPASCSNGPVPACIFTPR